MKLNARLAWLLLLAIPFLLSERLSSQAQSQSAPSSLISLPTDLRKQNPGWWPTKGDASKADFAGSEACAECHEAKFESQQTTPMAHAAVRAISSENLRKHPRLTFDQGPYAYELVSDGQKVTFTVHDSKSAVSKDFLWALGSGHMGQTYLYQDADKFYESRLSLFVSTEALDITPGQAPSAPSSLELAAGRPMEADETKKCFGCHTSGSMFEKQFNPADATPGVTCEACHGPGAKHVAAARARAEQRGSGLILNPEQLERVDSVDFCGACHRTWQDVVSGNLTGIGVFNVRFAPYRLENSKCWKKGDGRLACVACHDPHKPLVRDGASYDSNCLACHVTGAAKRTANQPGPRCPVGTQNCVSCHMPKVTPPALHSTFTDHWIRVVKTGAPYPN